MRNAALGLLVGALAMTSIWGAPHERMIGEAFLDGMGTQWFFAVPALDEGHGPLDVGTELPDRGVLVDEKRGLADEPEEELGAAEDHRSGHDAEHEVPGDPLHPGFGSRA